MMQIVGRLVHVQPAADYSEAFSNMYEPPAPMYTRTHRYAEIAAVLVEERALGVAMSLADVDSCFRAMVERSHLHERVHTIGYEDLLTDFAREMASIMALSGSTRSIRVRAVQRYGSPSGGNARLLFSLGAR